MFGRLLRRQPELDNFEYNRGGVGHGDPDAHGLDWQSGPGTNAQTPHLLRLIAPPLIGYGQRRLPQETYQKDEEKCEAEGAPVNEWPGDWEEADRRNESNEHKESEILGEPFPDRREHLLVKDRSHDEEDSEQKGGQMKAEKAINLFRFHTIVRHVVGGQPVFVQPEVEQKYGDKACQIKDVFFDWNWFMERRCEDLQRRCGVGENKKAAGEKEVGRKSQGNENSDCPAK